MEEKSSAGETPEKTFDYQEYLRQKLDKTLFSRCADEDGSFYAAKIVTNLETLIEAAAKTMETDLENAGNCFLIVPSEDMERFKKFIAALSRTKEQLGLAPLSGRDTLTAWIDHAADEKENWYIDDDDEIPVGENREPLCSELYLDELACDVFGNICFEFDGSEAYFANHIAATANRIATQMTDDLNNGVVPNEDIILSFIAVFEEIASRELADMIQSEEDVYEELDESDPDYEEKYNLLLEAFTDMDKDACYTGINNGIFMGTLTGPDIRVESMQITAYTPNSNAKKKAMYVTATYAYVRDTPNGTVITALGKGTEVIAYESEYHVGEIWHKVSFVDRSGNARSGWIIGSCLSETKPGSTGKPSPTSASSALIAFLKNYEKFFSKPYRGQDSQNNGWIRSCYTTK